MVVPVGGVYVTLAVSISQPIEKAVKQAINETDFDGYVKQNVNSIIRDTTKAHLRDTITQQLVGNWFNKMKVTVDILTKDGKSILEQGDTK